MEKITEESPKENIELLKESLLMFLNPFQYKTDKWLNEDSYVGGLSYRKKDVYKARKLLKKLRK